MNFFGMNEKIKMVLKWAGIVLVVLILASVVLSSLNSARSGMGVSNSANYPSLGYDGGMMKNSYERSGAPAYNSQDSATTNQTSTASTDRQVIKTGSLSLVVKDVEASANEITTIATGLKGFITDRNISDSTSGKKSGSIVVRVPSDSFENAITSIKGLAQKVTRDQINAQDVSEEYVDLQSQLKNKRAVEAQYLNTLSRAISVEDILKVQQRLDVTRGEIERLTGQVQYLERQVSMSTINISLVSESEVAVFGVVWEPLTKIKQAAYDALDSLVSLAYFVINLIFMLPVLIMWFVIYGGLAYVAWRIFLRIKKIVQTPRV
jgi:hypothetical protein